MENPPAASPPRKSLDVVAYLKLFRFPLVFTAIADSAAGYLVARSPVGPSVWRDLGLLALSSGGLYCFGMAMNDIADRKRDMEIAPTRVLPSGRISLMSAVYASIAILAISLTAIIFVSGDRLGQRLLLWGLVLAGILTYNFFLKVPPIMGFIRACNLLLGVSTGIYLGSYHIPVLIAVALPVFVYVTFLTYVSTLEETGVRGPRLVAGTCGMVLAVPFAANWLAIAGPAVEYVQVASATTWTSAWENITVRDRLRFEAFIVALVLAGWIIFRAWKAKDRKGIMLLVRDGVGGIILLHSALLMSTGLGVAGLMVAALVIPAAVSVAIFKRLA